MSKPQTDSEMTSTEALPTGVGARCRQSTCGNAKNPHERLRRSGSHFDYL
jgi:hypothetical protein